MEVRAMTTAGQGATNRRSRLDGVLENFGAKQR
jgi:hypothetical protein